MEKENYHHGNLRKQLIDNGLKLLNKDGYEGLSLRKVASSCGVSHAAPYKHFKNKEELILAIYSEINDEFEKTLQLSVENFMNDTKKRIIELGKAYVKFMVENPELTTKNDCVPHRAPKAAGSTTARNRLSRRWK